MASPSSLPSSSSFMEYEIFLSFRGEDTRNTFTRFLYQALQDKGLRTFMDELRLEIGESFSEGLWRAIECSAACIVILSEHYADSKWCLKELAKMVQSKKTILPIFFHVDPSHVRKQQGPFEQAFIKYEERSNLPCDNREHIEAEEIKEWRKALNEVGNIKGYDLDHQYNGNVPQLIQIITKKVVNKFNTTPPGVAKHPIGIDWRVAKMVKLLNLEAEDVKMIGIYGIGGIGKTTLAKAVYNKICSNFSGSCLLKDIREEAHKNGLVKLQEKLICKILNDENLAINNVDEGCAMIKRRLLCKRVLIVLDDIDDIKQLDALSGGRDWFGAGSRIIITTRDMHVLNLYKVSDHEIYSAEELNSEESLQLFSWHAFGREEPIEGYEEISRELVSVTSGLPLALETFGSDLFDKTSIAIWREMLESLRLIPHNEVEKRLRISYDGLKDEEKAIYLDIVSFSLVNTENM